jgi:hypothetical protein
LAGVLGQKPVVIKMIDAKTKEHVETLEVDACMVATGRVPNTKELGLENMGIETMRGFIQVRIPFAARPTSRRDPARALRSAGGCRWTIGCVC